MNSDEAGDPIDGHWQRFGRSVWETQDALGRIAQLSRDRGDLETEVWALEHQAEIVDGIADFVASGPDTTELFVCGFAGVLTKPDTPPPAPIARFEPRGVRQVAAHWLLRQLVAAVYPCSVFVAWWWRQFDQRTLAGKLPLVVCLLLYKTHDLVRHLGGIPKPRLLTFDELKAEGSIPADWSA